MASAVKYQRKCFMKDFNFMKLFEKIFKILGNNQEYHVNILNILSNLAMTEQEMSR